MRSAWLVLAMLWWSLQPAAADPLAKPAAAEARKHLSLGNKLYAVRSFDEAVAEYKAGALIEAALGKAKEAVWHYERFLNRGHPEGQLLDAVNGFVAEMRAALEKEVAAPAEPPPPAPSVAPAPAPWRVVSDGSHVFVGGAFGGRQRQRWRP